MLGTVQGGRYRILQEISRSGFDVTYLAEDIHIPGRPKCIVKKLEPLQRDPFSLQVIKRLFASEAELLVRLGEHDQIPRIIAYFEEYQELFLVQEFIDGHDLSREIIPGKQLSESYVLTLLQDILQILEFVHNNNVIHRDIKPSNLIRRASDEKIIIIDFLASKQLIIRTKITESQKQEQDRTVSQKQEEDQTVAIGTPGYMPTEQAQGQPRLSSDIYAVGITGIQALTGVNPREFQEDPATGEIIWRNLVKVTPKLAAILDKMVRYHHSERYQSATEALQAIQNLSKTQSPLLLQEDQNYQILLNQLKNYWIQGVLEKILQEKPSIHFKLESKLDGYIYPPSEETPHILTPDDIKVIQFFDWYHTLLILGEAGVGKTVILLELARELIDRAEQDISQPIPIIFKLSSWNIKKGGINTWFRNQTIEDWLIQEFKKNYNLPQENLKKWIDNKRVILLLDGLEEVKVNSRNACVIAINEFCKEYDIDMVVTSRIQDYENLKQRLRFQSAIYLNPYVLENESRQEFELTESERITETSSVPETAIVYAVLLRVLKYEISVGGELEVTIILGNSAIFEESAYLITISKNQTYNSELNIILNAPGFQLKGDNTASLPLDPDIAQETQTACFRLTALRPGSTNITAELYRGDTFETKLETQIQVADIDEATFIPQSITTQPRPVPQPDFILRIQTIWNETNSICKFQYQLKSFRFPSVFPGNNIYTPNSLLTIWIEQVRGLLATTLENISDNLPQEGKSRLVSLGQYLFGHIFPTELQTDFRSLIPQNSTFTLLILADQEAWIPWELLHDGQKFLGDRFIIGRWIQELNDTRPYEFPVGAVNVAHYANVEQPQLWSTLLEAPGAPPPQPLPAGVLHDSTEAIRGLHLIRYSQSSDADLRNAPVTLDNINNTEDIELQMRPAKLNLRRNRPFVTLSYVKTDAIELTALENTWASAFIRAGCSGFTGSLWAVESSVEAAFISGFYNRLWAGASLGEAFYTSRQLARAAAPDSLDWLAYVLFGDPMARPYRPVPGDGYAIVEPIGREIDDPLPPGASIRFRVTLRRNPPVWHEDRVIEVAENLVFENLQVHIVTYGLQVIPDLPVTMTLTAKGDYLGWFTLVVPNEITEKSALVQVYFADGMRPIHSLNFSLKIENGREE
ncbi:protein kinase [Calothrix sp. FACHB-1219]|nr:protein kinase [Calothrix sp. FACHB-168]MBD2220218.1 protein kinase [Calothrix sp. FACHB-1219]